VFSIDREAHTKLYVELAEDTTQRTWQQAFIKGVGYRFFSLDYKMYNTC
jgi:hypothetical protein